MTKLLALMALATSTFTAPGFGAQIPRKAPEFVFKMADGSQQLLSMYKGKAIVLAFMYTTCPHCQKTAQVLTQIQKEYAAKGVQMLGAVFDQGAAQRVVEFHNGLGLNFPVGVSDTRAVLEYLQFPIGDPYFVPILVFIDKHGMIRSQYIGDEAFLSHQEVNIRAEIDKFLKGTTTTSSTAAQKTPKS
ncbi:MAG: TlpA disulfide reductase family protein [Bryobacteraceae bacterium]|jgi:peroxiredoxin